MTHKKVTLYELYQIMFQEMGPQGWWPADSKEEIILGAILVQNTNWGNVEKSLTRLKKITQFNVEKILTLTPEELIEAIKPSGFYKNKSQAIKVVFDWLQKRYVDFEKISQESNNLRKELLTLHGIGEETADVLLLYVFDQSVFISDSYARRLFSKISNNEFKNYQEMNRAVQLTNEFSLEEAQEFHGLIDEFGKQYLKETANFEKSFLANIKLI